MRGPSACHEHCYYYSYDSYYYYFYSTSTSLPLAVLHYEREEEARSACTRRRSEFFVGPVFVLLEKVGHRFRKQVAIAQSPSLFRMGHGGEAPVCGGPASQCSLTPCPGLLPQLPREIARSGTPLTPRVSALRGDSSQGPRRGWFLYTTSLYDANILPHGRISIAPRPHQGHPWAGPCPHARRCIPHDFTPFARDPRSSTGLSARFPDARISLRLASEFHPPVCSLSLERPRPLQPFTRARAAQPLHLPRLRCPVLLPACWVPAAVSITRHQFLLTLTASLLPADPCRQVRPARGPGPEAAEA